MSESLDIPPPFPSSIGGYEILSDLSPRESVLAVAPGNRIVVLKMLDRDCLLRSAGGQKLHPSIRDRLARVRELAHARVANLHGVERDGPWVYLVWEYIAGRTLLDWAGDPEIKPRDLLLVARELLLTVDALHARGIVHGAIHGRNVIIDDAGRLKLTHVSPLLYTDAEQDTAAISVLFGDLASRRGEEDSVLARLAEDPADPGKTLRSMGARVSSLIDLRRDEASEDAERQADQRRRRASRIGAAAVVLLALLISYGLKRYTSSMSAGPPPPPEASAAAIAP